MVQARADRRLRGDRLGLAGLDHALAEPHRPPGDLDRGGQPGTGIITRANAAAALHNPKGYLDSAAGGRGSVRATGWAADPDLPSNPVNLDGRMRGRFSTGVARPDVAAAMRVGPNQGFAITVARVTRGAHTSASTR